MKTIKINEGALLGYGENLRAIVVKSSFRVVVENKIGWGIGHFLILKKFPSIYKTSLN